LAARRGKQRATVAVGHTILRIAYHLLQDPASVYDERGSDVTERDRQAIERDLVQHLQRFGNTVVLHQLGAT
jgi:transposase